MKNSQKGSVLNVLLIAVILILVAVIIYLQVFKEPETVYEQIPVPVQSAVVETTPQPIAASTTNSTKAGWKLYTNTTHGYSIQYPASFDVTQGDDLAVSFPESLFKGSNYSGVDVVAFTSAVDQNTCYYTLDGNTVNTDDKKLSDIDKVVIKNGIPFHMVYNNDHGMGQTMHIEQYSTMHNGTCYQVRLVAHSFSITPDYPNIVAYNPATYVNPTFDQILGSFAFAK